MPGSSTSKERLIAPPARRAPRPLGRGDGDRRLRLKGYRLLARRFKTPHGEIDLIMRRGRVTAFIEVKQRSDLDSASPRFRRIRRGGSPRRRASGWPATGAPCGDCRFDIVGVSPYRWPRHIPNAFEARE